MSAVVAKLPATSPDRHKLDRYWTPKGYTKALLARVSVAGTVLEPSAGNGAISTLLARQASVSRLITADIVDDPSVQIVADMREAAPWLQARRMLHPAALERHELPKFDWVVMNPPFYCAVAMLQLALDHARNVAMLCRQSFLEPTGERFPVLDLNAPAKQIVLPRYNFRPDKKSSDNQTCQWLVWSDTLYPQPFQFVSKAEFRSLQG